MEEDLLYEEEYPDDEESRMVLCLFCEQTQCPQAGLEIHVFSPDECDLYYTKDINLTLNEE